MSGTFEGWTEGMVMSILFVIIFGAIVIGGMNTIHNDNQTIEGLNTTGLQSAFENYQETAHSKVSSGEVSLSGLYTTLSTSWDILSSLLITLMSFVAGGWIRMIVHYMMLPEEVGFMLQGLYIVAFIFIILRILFKTKV